MPIDITREPATPETLQAYARIPIAFAVTCRFDIVAGADDAWTLTERAVSPAYVKDYDAIDGGPTSWPKQFDLAWWTVLVAHDDGARVGGAVVSPAGAGTLVGVGDAPVLWDIRVAPTQQCRGIGATLLRAAERLCIERGDRTLWVETQDVNVPACRFYARHGYVLAGVERGAYPALPDEVRLTWRKDLYA